MMTDDRLIGIAEAARTLGVNRRTLRIWTTEGRFPCVKTPGGHRRFRISDVTRMVRGEADNGSKADDVRDPM